MGDNHQITLTEWAETKRELERAIMDVKQGFIRTGYCLRKIRDGKLYEQDGYDSLAKWASEKYNLNGPTVSRLIAINEQFSEDGYSRVLDKRYEGFSFGMLVEMKDISEENRALITKDTPREDVREIRRYEKDAATGIQEAAEKPEDIQETEESENAKVFREFLEGQYGSKEQVEELEEALASENPEARVKDIVCPSGQRMWRSGAKLLIFRLTEISVKRTFFGPQEKTGWEEFLDVLGRWTPEKKTALVMAAEAAAERERRNREEEEREKLALARERAEEEKKEEDHDEGRSEESENGEDGDDHDIREPEAGAPTDEPEGDVCRDVEAPQGGTGKDIETVEAEIVEEPRVADIAKIPPVMPKPADDTSDLTKKAENAYKAIGRAVEKAAWKKAATEVRKLLTYIEKLEDMEK